jgi:hypothetical protein
MVYPFTRDELLFYTKQFTTASSLCNSKVWHWLSVLERLRQKTKAFINFTHQNNKENL